MKKVLVACALVSVALLGCKKEIADKEPTNASGARTELGSSLQEDLKKAQEQPAQ